MLVIYPFGYTSNTVVSISDIWNTLCENEDTLLRIRCSIFYCIYFMLRFVVFFFFCFLLGGDFLNVPQLMTSLQPRAATCTEYKIPTTGKALLLQPNLLGSNLGTYMFFGFNARVWVCVRVQID